jgi:hypothetical protein
MAAAFDEATIDFDKWVDTLAPALGFSVEGADREAVIVNLRMIARNAGLIDAFALPDEAEPAPIFFVEDLL